MASQETVTINGRLYDKATGMPIEEVVVTTADKKPIKAPKPAPAPIKKSPPSTSRGTATAEGVHSNVQRSKTLVRRTTKKPAVPQKVVTKRTAPGRHMDIAKSATVSRFAKHPSTQPSPASVTKAVTAPISRPAAAHSSVKTAPSAQKPDKPVRAHPLVARAHERIATQQQKKAPTAQLSAKQVKEAQIAKALATPKPKAATSKKKSVKKIRALIITASVIVLVGIIGFIGWRLLPTVSVSIAAAQAGIEAKYPEYTPDGYSLSQPVTYSDGEVDLKFTSNSNDNYYTIYQTRSSWDSSAVLDNVITPAAGANYVTTKERGLTIYTYESHAVWVNGGILYKIESKASLSGEQIRRIAISL